MPHVAAALAANLRRLREERQLTASDLALRSGVAKATLSQLEAGRGNPRLETLADLAAALGVAVADLIATAEPVEVRVVRRGEGIAMRHDVLPSRLVRSFPSGPYVIEFYELFVAPGGHERSDGHGLGAEEHVYVLEGSVRAGPLGAEVELGAGDYAAYPSDRPHGWEGTGKRGARVWVTHFLPKAGVNGDGGRGESAS